MSENRYEADTAVILELMYKKRDLRVRVNIKKTLLTLNLSYLGRTNHYKYGTLTLESMLIF